MGDFSYPSDLRYTKEHEWIRVEGNTATVGITAFAQDQLGDVVFVEVPKVGKEYAQFAQFGVVESVKTVSDLYLPVSGKVVEVNASLEAAPELVNKEPYGGGWMIRVEMANPGEVAALLTAEQYAEFIKSGGH